MRFVLASLFSAILASALLGHTAPAFAADDTWVSATGTDAGACAITAPCRSLRYALAQTTAGGTITILTPGRYAPVRINKSVHIMAAGVEAVIFGAASCGAAVCINAGPNDVVSLRGLTVNVDEPLKHGILFASGGGLELDRCVVRAYSGSGLLFSPGTAARLHVADSHFWGGYASAHISPTGGVQHVVFDRVFSEAGLHGFQFGGGAVGSIVATVRESKIFPSGSGIGVITANGAVPIELMIERSVFANSSYGIEILSQQNALVRVGESTFSGHDLEGVGGFVDSYGTNKVVAAIDGVAIPNVIPLK